MNDRFLIIDGHALTYRSYYAFLKNHRITKNGLITSAIFGFTNTTIELIKKLKPNYICVAFDTKIKTWRHIKSPEYKINRPKQPEDITKSFPYIFDILDGFNINFYSKEGFEADDIIGTISQKIPTNIDVFIVTPDKDYDQLVKNNVFLYKPDNGKYKLITVNEVLKKWDINNTEQVIDVLAIIGDSCDNVIGIKGIGIKTASKLIKKYNSIENIIEKIDSLPDSIKSKFKKNIDKVILSKELVKIKKDCDVNFNLEGCKIKNMNSAKIIKLFTELEFNSLLKKISEKINNESQGLF